jgi:prevent-host-death family protein
MIVVLDKHVLVLIRLMGLVDCLAKLKRSCMSVVNTHYAKTHLSRLLELVAAGEEVIIARAGKPIARLVPLEKPPQPRRLGFVEGRLTDAFFESLLQDELDAWGQ